MTSFTGPLPLAVRFAVFPGNRLQVNWIDLRERGEDLGCAYWMPTGADSVGFSEQYVSLSGQHMARVALAHRPKKDSKYFNAISSTSDGQDWQPGATDESGEFHDAEFEQEGVEWSLATTWVEGGSFRAHYRIREPGERGLRDHYVELDASGVFVAFGYEGSHPDGGHLACRSQDGSVWVTEDRASRVIESGHVGELRAWAVAFEDDDFAQPQTVCVCMGRWDQGFCAGRGGGFGVERLGDSGSTRMVWCDPASANVHVVRAVSKENKTISAVPGAVSRPDAEHIVKRVGIQSGDEAIIPKLVRVRAVRHGRRTYLAQYDLGHKSRPVYVVAFDSRAFPTGEALYLDALERGRVLRTFDFGKTWSPAPAELPIAMALQS
ncbi:MAG: hypothetical protein ACE5O2_06765 [Armatimonadota bacterium]